MKPLKRLANLFTGKKILLEKNINHAGVYLAERAGNLSGRELKNFFQKSIICCMSDALEYFLEIDTAGNVFYKNIQSMEAAESEKFIKWEVSYHTLFFTKEMKADYREEEFEDALFYIFEFSAEDRAKYKTFKTMLAKDESEFSVKFSNAAACDIFNITEISSINASFIYNFYFNCYTEFCRLFTKYTPVM